MPLKSPKYTDTPATTGFPSRFILITFFPAKRYGLTTPIEPPLSDWRRISYSFYLIHLFVLLSYAKWQKESDFHNRLVHLDPAFYFVS